MWLGKCCWCCRNFVITFKLHTHVLILSIHLIFFQNFLDVFHSCCLRQNVISCWLPPIKEFSPLSFSLVYLAARLFKKTLFNKLLLHRNDDWRVPLGWIGRLFRSSGCLNGVYDGERDIRDAVQFSHDFSNIFSSSILVRPWVLFHILLLHKQTIHSSLMCLKIVALVAAFQSLGLTMLSFNRNPKEVQCYRFWRLSGWSEILWWQVNNLAFITVGS